MPPRSRSCLFYQGPLSCSCLLPAFPAGGHCIWALQDHGTGEGGSRSSAQAASVPAEGGCSVSVPAADQQPEGPGSVSREKGLLESRRMREIVPLFSLCVLLMFLLWYIMYGSVSACAEPCVINRSVSWALTWKVNRRSCSVWNKTGVLWSSSWTTWWDMSGLTCAFV